MTVGELRFLLSRFEPHYPVVLDMPRGPSDLTAVTEFQEWIGHPVDPPFVLLSEEPDAA